MERGSVWGSGKSWVPGHWAATILLRSLDIELHKKGERFLCLERASLHPWKLRSHPQQAGSGGPAKPSGHRDRQVGPRPPPGLL